MPFKNKQHGQFGVLMISNIESNCTSLKHNGQNITLVTEQDDILMLIATTQFDLILFDLAVNCSSASVSEQLMRCHHPWQSASSAPDRFWHSHHPRQSASSAPDRFWHSRHPWQSEFITRIRDSLCINNKTPVVAIINPAEAFHGETLYSMGFDDWLTKPLTEEQLNEVIDFWQAKALVSNHIQIILRKTKNNQRLALTIFEKLFEELPLQIICIKDALENGQYNLAQEITHKLNGSASFCGLVDIQQPANALESCLLNNNYAYIHQHFLLLKQCTLNFTRHQKTILATLHVMAP